MKGFMDETAWKKQREPLPLAPLCDKCGLFKLCKSPMMPHSGEGRRKVLIVAEAPGETEDDKGTQLVGNAGFELVSLLRKIDVNMRKDCWLDNSIRCRPTDEHGQNRKPTTAEIDYCRPNVSKTLKLTNPDVIIPMGEPAVKSIVAMAWKRGEVSEVGSWVGWQIPSIKLNAWICPTYHPSFLLRSQREGSNPAVELHMLRHLRKAFELQGKPWRKKPNYEDRIFVYHKDAEAVDAIVGMTERAIFLGLPLAFDYETTCLKPESPHAEIICFSVSDGTTAIACPFTEKTAAVLSVMLKSKVPKIAANLRFEERWTRRFLRHGVFNWHWDTVLGAHWRNCHTIRSLKFQSFVLLGVDDYDYLIDEFKGSKDNSGNSPNRLKEVDPTELMKYCAYDSLFEWLVAHKQMEV